MTTATTTPEFGSLREKIAYEKAEREARYAEYADIWQCAVEAGQDTAATTPEVIALNCGFAWIVIKPGTSSFARWLVKQGHASKRYNGGVQVFVYTDGQDVDRKRAVATAMADVLKARLPEDVARNIWVASRLD